MAGLRIHRREHDRTHSQRRQTLRVYTGNAFDLGGERRQTQFEIDNSRRTALESFEIQIEEPLHAARFGWLESGATWEFEKHSHTFLQTDSRTLEFRIQMKPEEEMTLTYTALYKW